MGAYSNYSSFLGNLDAFTSIAVAKEGNVERAIRAVLAENARVKQFGFTPTELARAKQEFFTSVQQAYTERDKTRSASFVNEYVQNFTDKAPYTSIEFYFNFLKNIQPGITLPEVNALVDQFIHNDNRAVIIMAPEKDKDKLPSREQVLSYVNDAAKNLTAYEDNHPRRPPRTYSANPFAGGKRPGDQRDRRNRMDAAQRRSGGAEAHRFQERPGFVWGYQSRRHVAVQPH